MSNIVDLGGKPVTNDPKPSTFTFVLKNAQDPVGEPYIVKAEGFLSYTPAFVAVIKNENQPVFFAPYDRVLEITVS